jgi:hypothetical protein|tara:strand:- start:216 stop:491 length:276 start_codon:yes stop_codon:yes gene_type:complete
MSQPTELELDEIKKTIRHLDIFPHHFSPNIIKGWEKEYDTQLDITNLAMYVWDRYNEPIKYLHTIKKCIRLPRIRELKQENRDLMSKCLND